MRTLRVFALLLVCAAEVSAQAAKRPLTQADWDRWRSIAGATISDDGKWVAYTLNPRVGDGDFVVRATSGPAEYHVNLGYTNRENNTPGAERGRGGTGAPPAGGGGRGGRGGGGGGSNGPFTADSRYALVMVTQPPKAVVDSIERSGRGAGRGGRGAAQATEGEGESTPSSSTSLRIIRLADGNVETIPGARGFRLPEASAKWLIYTPAPDSAGGGVPSAAGRGGAAGGAVGGGRGGRGGRGGGGGGGGENGSSGRRSYGGTIVLRNLGTGAEERLSDVLAYTFDDSAKVLAYTVASRDSTKDGVYVRDLSSGATKTILSGPGNYRSFTFDRSQTQFVFSSDRDEFGKPNARATIYHGTLRGATAQPVLTPDGIPSGMRFPDNVSPTFTRAGNAVMLTVAPPPEEVIPPDSLVGKARFDLWHWQDVQIQPTQLLQVNQARNRTYQGLLNLTTKKFVQLTSDSIPNVSLSDDARIGFASSGVRYNLERTWGDGGNDVYIVDPATGSAKLIAAKISGQGQLSVDAKYALWFDKGHWYTYNIASGKTTNVTAPLKGVRFDQETFSTPGIPSAWGVAGWTKGDRSVLLYDRFDLWELDPAGVRPPVIVTDSVGRRENMQFRLIALGRDEEDRAFDPARPLYFRAFDEDTKASGYYRDRLDARTAPEKIVMADMNLGAPQKAKNAEMYMMTKSTFVDFPNLWVGPTIAETNTKVSDANPWQKEYVWGTAELVEWLSADGVPRQGILYKPENFDPSKKYPMITYFYEDLSDGLHSYIAPNGGTSVNITHYVSNGYLMFEPDIFYEMGHPGMSALKSIVPGVQKLLDRGYVDPKGLGLQGHSWGGYQTAFLVTQTTMFSAAEAGAPVSNMISAYGGIRWESGVNRAMQYEAGQSRIGKSVWEGLPLYIENSPLFGLERVQTPLLILHNDQDGAVPWYQGIELYIGMRRLSKEAYLFNYNNEPHGIQGRANQKDWAMRMQQFFDAKLKGAPTPDWMVHGIPAKDKGKDQIIKPIIHP
jgi:hypothetical protein